MSLLLDIWPTILLGVFFYYVGPVVVPKRRIYSSSHPWKAGDVLTEAALGAEFDKIQAELEAHYERVFGPSYGKKDLH